jgi:mono/diheme cytochrome c family protein
MKGKRRVRLMSGRLAAVIGGTGLAVAAAGYLQLHAVSGATLQTGSERRALIDQYCVSCHNERLKTAGLAFERLDLSDIGANADVWEKVATKLRGGSMPPAGRPRPDAAAAGAFVASLETALDRAALAHPNPGRPVSHRLNRTEYANAVRDLLAVEIDRRSILPGDDADKNGFDNIADILSVSPVLLERYMAAARQISRLAVGRPTTDPKITRYDVPKMLQQDERLGDDLPFGSRGGAAIRHYFPVDGEYLIKIRLQRNLYDVIRGLGRPHQLDVRLDGARVTLFTVGGEEHGEVAPVAFGGTIDGSPEWEKYAREADARFEVRLPVKAGSRVVAAAFLSDLWMPDDVLQPRQIGFGRDTNELFEGMPALDSLTVTGPFQTAGPGDTPSRRKVFVCRPARSVDEDACSKQILNTLARRAYRGEATEDDLQTLDRFYKSRSGESFDARIELALQMILASPKFLFRIERDPANVVAPGTPYRVSDLELASRLSFFLWSSIPDDELLDLASRSRLRDPAVLERQVRRMLADKRSNALVDNFASQWLVLRNVRDATPDPDVFPDFDENLRQAFQRETELFVASQMAEDRSLIELVSANYTFVNERLARHYRIPNVYGDRFRRVTFTDEDARGGLLTQGSLLTVTSYPNRTSPVLRGKWLLENFIGTPPPEPPPNVPALKEKGEGGKPQSVRERLEEHRKNPACSTCHAPMDPLGFALENFDAVGAWRTTDSGATIDSIGTLPSGVQIRGVAGLRQVLTTTYRQQFIRTVTEKLLIYALGRGVERYDMPAVRAITRQAEANDYRWSAVIQGVVNSLPFQMRRSES